MCLPHAPLDHNTCIAHSSREGGTTFRTYLFGAVLAFGPYHLSRIAWPAAVWLLFPGACHTLQSWHENQSAPACLGLSERFALGFGRTRWFGLFPVWLLGLLLGCALLLGLESQWFRRFITIEGGTKSPAQYLEMAAVALYFLNVDISNADAAERKASMKKAFFLAAVVGTAISASLNSATVTCPNQ